MHWCAEETAALVAAVPAAAALVAWLRVQGYKLRLWLADRRARRAGRRDP